MLTASRQIVVLGFMLVLLIAAAAALSAQPAQRGPVGISAPVLSRAEPVASIGAGQFEQRWGATLTVASR